MMLARFLLTHGATGVGRHLVYVEEGEEGLAADGRVAALMAAGRLELVRWSELPVFNLPAAAAAPQDGTETGTSGAGGSDEGPRRHPYASQVGRDSGCVCCHSYGALLAAWCAVWAPQACPARAPMVVDSAVCPVLLCAPPPPPDPDLQPRAAGPVARGSGRGGAGEPAVATALRVWALQAREQHNDDERMFAQAPAPTLQCSVSPSHPDPYLAIAARTHPPPCTCPPPHDPTGPG